jgi:hypothetical protein
MANRKINSGRKRPVSIIILSSQSTRLQSFRRCEWLAKNRQPFLDAPLLRSKSAGKMLSSRYAIIHIRQIGNR